MGVDECRQHTDAEAQLPVPFLPLCALHSSKSSPSWLWQDPSLLLSSLVSHSSLEVGSCALTGGPG